LAVDASKKAELVSAMQSKYEGSVLNGDSLHNPPRIPFENLELNYITGGGIPMGRWSRFYGGWSSTKTRTCYALIAEAQRMGLECAYYNVEKQYTTEAAERAGIDTKKLLLVEGTTIEQVGEAMEGFMEAVHFHVLDSASGAISIDELEADISDWRPGIKARAWGKTLSRVHERMDPQENTVVIIDQLRTSGMMKGKSRDEPPGGKYLQYLSSLNLNFQRGGWIHYDKHGNLSEKQGKAAKTLGGNDDPEGRIIKVRNESRIGRPERSASLYFDLNHYDFDIEWEYVKALKTLGWAKQSGSWWEVATESAEGKVQGDRGLRELLVEYPDLMQEIMDAVMSMATYIPAEETDDEEDE
jgi:RecA/RadA recombinase